MGIAKKFNQTLRNQTRMFAAWLPVTNTFAVGDFGVMSGGVFVRMGNITNDLEVVFETQEGEAADLDYRSDRVQVTTIGGGAGGDAGAGGSFNASLKIHFAREESFYLQAKGVTLTQMQSTMAVAKALASQPNWNWKKYRVVSGTYEGKRCTLLSSRHRDTEVTIGGRIEALEDLDLAEASANFHHKSTKNLGLEIIGNAGVVGLELFRILPAGIPDTLGFERAPEIIETPGGENIIETPSGEKLKVLEGREWAEEDLEDDI